MKTKVGLKRYHSLDIGLGLWRWELFRFFNSLSSHIEYNSVSSQYSEISRAISITIGKVRRIDVHTLPILSFPLCCTQPVGEAQKIKKIRKNF